MCIPSLKVCFLAFFAWEYKLTFLSSRLLDSTFPKDPGRPLNHLRRFVKESFLPETLRNAIESERQKRRKKNDNNNDNEVPIPTIFVLIAPPVPDLAQLRTLLAPFVPSTPTLTPTPAPAHANNSTPSTDENSPPKDEEEEREEEENSMPIHHLTVPLQPPLTQHQADQWTNTFWPTNFNAAFPRSIIAPPVKILDATKTNIRPKAGYYLGLACKVAQEAKLLKRGRGIGVVVVDPSLALASVGNGDDDKEEVEEEDAYDNGIVAVAGDARYIAPGIVTDTAEENRKHNPDCEGGPEFHAIMRVIEMVAMRRRADSSAAAAATTSTSTSAITGDVHNPSLSPLETHYLYRPNSSTTITSPNQNRILTRSAGGYLCTDLDIYITHEPCLSCSMGILLSRFRAVTFPRRGRLRSGGLASSSPPYPLEQEDGHSHDEKKKTTEDRDVYYGLHWRAELNWRAMCFEFVQGDEDARDGVEEVGDYYA
ncbi:hypothetical protein UA08_05912 [Talaromyces atroroseus]|uniref:Uncharacterized protein n=1 Tax=Talaromyces atroroseus TaxID=1441469 RepID=A0A225ACW6_TALAT|nr:hypothetical protein UA08_05912 [Talaromyces atroroseus]OKL58991.1 hypothetical protein UA08_05912 [Talaromyces atroroseus]